MAVSSGKCLKTALAAIVLLLATTAARADELTPLDLRRVKVQGEIGRRVEITIKNNLLVLNVDKDFLAPFLDKKQPGGYIALGKLIDATVKFAACTGDAKVLALKQRLVEQVLRAQQADGYIGLCRADARMSALWDIHEMGYLVYGLVTDYQYFGQQQSLDAARKAADYILAHWSNLPKDWQRQTAVATHVAVTGLERALLALYRQTNDRRYLDFCLGPRALADWDLGIVVGRRPLIEGHVYAYMSRCLAQLELYRLQPQERLLGQTRRAIAFLTRHDGLMITGGAGQLEIWTDDQDGRGDLGETCATAYQIRVYESLLRLRGEARYGDLTERTIYNALAAAQSPDGRQLRYYAPIEGDRVYFGGDTYCCPGNFRRIVAELPGMIYYRSGRGVAVNLYTASQAQIDLDGDGRLAIRQETEYPSAGRVVIRLDPSKPGEFPLRLRIPAWAAGAKAAVNGQALEGPIVTGAFLEINRPWKAGDQVTLDLPMNWRLVRGRLRQAGRVAVMRGPLVFCLNPRRNPSLPKQDGADLGRYALDPSSFAPPVRDDSIRPGGIACRLDAWLPGCGLDTKGDTRLVLTEFADPEGKATYFRLRDFSVAVDDELLGSGR